MVVNQLILNLISGGLVGYTTNLLAVKMLSKKYPIFGGDIISKNSDELKNNLNNILENRLKNNQEINNIFENSEFKLSFNELIDQSFESFINNENNQIKILDLPDSDLLIKNISDFISKIDLFESIDLNVFLNQLKIKDLLGNEQTSIFANKFYNLIMKVINPEIKSFLVEIYSGLKDKRIDELVEKDILNKLLNNFELIFNDIRPKLASIDGDITLFIQESLAKIDIDIILESLEKNIKAKKIIEIIGSENKESLTKELVQHFIVFIDSDEGLDFLNKLAESLINLTKEIDSSLLDFLSPVLKVRIFEFIKKNIPYLADTAKDWLRINKKEIEVIIENTIDQYYSSQKSTLSQIKLRIKDLIGLKVSEYFKIVEKGIEQFENYIDNSASEDLTEEIIGFLNNKQLGNLFSELNLNKDVLATFFHQMIHQYLPKINTSIFDSFFEKNLEDVTGIFKVSIKEKFGDDIKLFLAKQIKYQIFYSSEINDQLQSIVKEKLENIKNDSFSSLLSVEKFDSYVSYLPIFLMFSQSKIVDKLIEEIKRQAENKSLSDIINQDIQEKIKHKITSLYGDNIEKLVVKIKEIKVASIYKKIQITENIINSSNLILTNNQDKAKIKIIGIIKSVINNINTEKFKNINKKLLVENTLPITMMGTTIGALSGLIIYFSQSFNVIGRYYNTPTNQLNLFISLPMTYAVIGLATNWLAIKLMFKPHKNKNIFLFNKQTLENRKKEFALDLSTFTDNKSILDEIINTNDFDNQLKNIILNDKEELKKIFNNKKSNLSLLNNLYQNISIYREKIIKDISKIVEEFEIKNISQFSFNNFFNLSVSQTKSFANSFLQKTIEGYKEKTVGQIISDKSKNQINTYLSEQINDKIFSYSHKIKTNLIEEKLSESLSQANNFLNLNVKLESFMSFDKSNTFQEKAALYLNKVMKEKIAEGTEKYIQHLFIDSELASDREINSLFNGELITFAKKNMYIALDKVIFGIGLEKLKDEKEAISEKIMSNIHEANKDSLLYGIGSSLLNIDKDIREIIYLLIEQRLEPYLTTKKWELENILAGYIDFISRKKLKEVGLTADILNSGNINKIINKFLDNKNIESSVNHLSVALINDILGLNLDFLLKLIGIDALEKIPDKFTFELDDAKKQIFNNINSNKEELNKLINGFTVKTLDSVIYSIPLDNILKNISAQDISLTVNNLTDSIYNSESFVKYKNSFSENIYKSFAEKKGDEIIDILVLEKELNNLFNSILENKDIRNIINKFIQQLLVKFTNQDDLVPKSTKDFLLKILSENILTSLKDKSFNFIQQMDLQNILKNEINNISIKDFDLIFNHSLNQGFNKIILSGWIGGIIGLIEAVIILNN